MFSLKNLLCPSYFQLFLSYRLEELFEPVELDLINAFEHHTQRAFRESFTAEPANISFGQIDQEMPFIFPKRHARLKNSDTPD